MTTSATFSTAVVPLGALLKLRWAELPRLRELHSRIVPPEQDPRPYVVALQAIQAEYIQTALIAHALCEALINCTLAFALVEKGTPELFNLLERSEFMDKWIVAPKTVSDDYAFNKATAIYETLRRLNRQRNFYVHNKASIVADEVAIFLGSQSEHRGLGEDLEWIHRYISLPFDLADFLRGYPQFSMPSVLLRREEVSQALQHRD